MPLPYRYVTSRPAPWVEPEVFVGAGHVPPVGTRGRHGCGELPYEFPRRVGVGADPYGTSPRPRSDTEVRPYAG
jgi:hypothetical protein